MSHQHHGHKMSEKNLFMTIILNVIITISQIIGGIASGSLALLSDALHNFSDVIALVIAYFANRLTAKPRTLTKTFGYKRAEVLAAFVNASALVGIGIYLIVESIQKYYNPQPIDSTWVIWLGMLSILLNVVSVLLIKDDASNNINIKAAYLHLMTDVMTSIAVVVGGILIYYYQMFWVDPMISGIIAIYLISASMKLLKTSTNILMQFTPANLDIDEIVNFIKENNEIRNVHHVHLWLLDEHNIHMEAHIDFQNNITLDMSNLVLDTLEESLQKYFDISHTTFQCEYNRHGDKSVII